MKLLTQSEANSLEDGTIIGVLWGGATEPVECEVITEHGVKYAFQVEKNKFHALNLVGKEKYKTRVWVIEKKKENLEIISENFTGPSGRFGS